MAEIYKQAIWALVMLFFLMRFVKSGIMDEDDETDLGEVVQYVDGDILIAVFVPVTSHGSDMKCNRVYNHATMPEQVNMFLEKINKDPLILPGIKLGAIVINSCSSENHSMRKLFTNVLMPHVMDLNCSRTVCNKEKRILAGVVGGASSGVSMDLASMLEIYHISQVSYWSTSTDLSDKSRFKYFFRTVPADSVQAEAMADFILKMRWNYVSVVYADTAYGIKGFQELSKSMKSKGICIAVSQPITQTESADDYQQIVSILDILLQQERAKAVILFATSSVALRVLKVTSNTSRYKNISWIASDGWSANLPTQDTVYADALHGTIGFSLKFPSIDALNERVRNLTIRDYRGENASLNPWWQDYLKHTKNCTTQTEPGMRVCDEDEHIPDYKASRNALDESMTVFVHALDAYHRNTCQSARGLCDEMARKAGTEEVAKALFQHVKDVKFLTSERRIFKFDENQDGPPLYNIMAFDKKRVLPHTLLDGWYTVGTYDDIDKVNLTSDMPEKVMLLNSVCTDECKPGEAKVVSAETCCWVCQKCTIREYAAGDKCVQCGPHDMPNANGTGCTPIPINEMTYSSGYTIACLSFGIFGLVCTAIVTGMYWKHRDSAIVRASGRELCFFVLAGVFLTLLNCFAVTAHPTALSCGLSRAILALGPAIIYAGLLMKTFRVVFIFQSKGILSTRTKGYLEPGPLIFLTICVLSVQVIILTVWMVLSPPTVYVFYAETDFTAFRTCKHICDERVYVGLAYPFLIILVCTILATVNRNVPTGFRETMFVGFTMYTTCVTWIAFQALFFTQVDKNRVERQLTTLSCALSISAITVLLCLFGPRCYTILRHPELNTSEAMMSRRSNGHCNPDRAVPHEPVGTISGEVNKAFSNIQEGDNNQRTGSTG